MLRSKDGVPIEESDEIKIENTPDGRCRLKILYSNAHAGSYKCIATSELGCADSVCKLPTDRELISVEIVIYI